MPVEPEIIGGAAVSAYLAKDGLQKLLGPTASYLGEGMKNIVAKRCEQIGKIFKKAEKKLGDRIEDPGEVPPRVLKCIVDDASYFNDELSAEYFGGILASSRSEAGRDDRGARLLALVNRMSSYQLRAHFYFYSAMVSLFKSESRSLWTSYERIKMTTFVRQGSFFKYMDFTPAEREQGLQIIAHFMDGMMTERLIDAEWHFGDADEIATHYPNIALPGLIFTPTLTGAELFLWSNGLGAKGFDALFEEDFSPAVDGLEMDVSSALRCIP